MKKVASRIFGLVTVLLAGCAITPPQDAKIRAIGIQTFGTDAFLKVEWIPYAGPITGAMSNLGSTDEVEAADAMRPGPSQRLDLVVWSES
jgi:hypothetical protein